MKNKAKELQQELSEQAGVHSFVIEPHREVNIYFEGQPEPTTVTGPCTLTINTN